MKLLVVVGLLVLLTCTPSESKLIRCMERFAVTNRTYAPIDGDTCYADKSWAGDRGELLEKVFMT